MTRVLQKCDSQCLPFLSGFRRLLTLFILGFVSIASAQENNDVAMITALQGSANLLTTHGVQALQPFSKLKRGDQLSLDSPALKLVFFDSGRQEIWHGKGKIEIQGLEGRGIDLPSPAVIIIPGFMAKQIAKTPSVDTVTPNSRTKLRSISGGGSIERIDSSYRKMRKEAVPGDLNPELFLLSALFELREIDRVEQVLSDLRATHPADQEARIVIALYQKAVKNYREGGGKQ